MNGKGQIVTWKLTKDLTFNNIVSHLNVLRERLQNKGSKLLNFTPTIVMHGEICFKVSTELVYMYV